MARSKRFVPILTEIVAALTVTAAYLSTSKDYGSVEVFFKHEVEAYSFESSQLDVWVTERPPQHLSCNTTVCGRSSRWSRRLSWCSLVTSSGSALFR